MELIPVVRITAATAAVATSGISAGVTATATTATVSGIVTGVTAATVTAPRITVGATTAGRTGLRLATEPVVTAAAAHIQSILRSVV